LGLSIFEAKRAATRQQHQNDRQHDRGDAGSTAVRADTNSHHQTHHRASARSVPL
jgi:hypothetical protein